MMMTDTTARARLLFGTDEPVEPTRRLSAGALSAELTAGNLGSIYWHGAEVLRGIAFLVRDTRWGTYAPKITAIEMACEAERFTVAYQATIEGGEGSFAYRVTIVGEADGRLRFVADGSSATGFATNRTGFVVLHGLDGVVGQPLKVLHDDRTVTQTQFPVAVQPDQPATAIARLRHEPRPGLAVDVTFEGDVFEMEDQRNWTDASFKTYCRPLSLGYPYRIEARETLSQAVDLQVTSGTAMREAAAAEPIRVEWGLPEEGVLPYLGLYVDSVSLSGAEEHAGAVAALRPSYLQARVDLRTSEPADTLDRASHLARSWRCPLQLDIIIAGVEPQAELAGLAAWFAAGRPELEAVFVAPARDLRSRPAGSIPSVEATPVAILAAARAILPGISLVGGMPVGFPELNRNPPPAGIDMLANATQAIVHAADDRSVMGTLEAFPYVIATARRLAGALPYRIGPATIGMPASASAAVPVENQPDRRTVMGARDPRQRGLFAASFLLGLVASSDGVTHLTPGAPVGDIGMLDDGGRPRPIALAYAELVGLSGLPRLAACCTAPNIVAAVAALTDNGPVLALANLTGQPVVVAVAGPTCRHVWMLDAEQLARNNPSVEMQLLAGCIVRLDSYAVCIMPTRV